MLIPTPARSGFSLVELSIVLVVLGLLVGGVLTGQSLIRAAELRSVTTEFQKYQAAVNTFRDKYFALPGDMNNATAFWGAATCPAGTGTGTCNGNGNGVLDIAPAAGQASEEFMAWQHLANAGLIEGAYSGISGTGGMAHSMIGVNIPRGKASNTGWSFIYPGNMTDPLNPDWFILNYGQILQLGAQNGIGRTGAAAFTATEAWNIDLKMDDGSPASGNVHNSKQTATNFCTTGTTNSAEYAVSLSDIVCRLGFTVWK
jgi:prepilin-type N-terminal cleavage/methylation domain-containing protein